MSVDIHQKPRRSGWKRYFGLKGGAKKDATFCNPGDTTQESMKGAPKCECGIKFKTLKKLNKHCVKTGHTSGEVVRI